MLFNSAGFLIFLPIVTIMYYLIPERVRHIWLLVCSYYFYMCWNAVYALLILTSTVITYICGICLERVKKSASDESAKARLKKLILFISLLLNLAILFYYKYFNFFVGNINAITAHLGFTLNIPKFDIILPVGISFYTFQALGYTIDVYRDDIYAEKSFLRYALFVSFFPQLVAGPIERSKNLLRQLAVPARFRFENLRDGLLMMLWGFFMKIVLADRIAIFVDCIYGENYALYGGWYVAVATILFAVQIYCDFGGYSAIAAGAAKILGVDLMENFDTPYLSATTSEFWRRWHISLSSWFRDYLYIPLGGNRKGKVCKYLNILITFSVSGLWHGAQWGYVIWGMLNGLYQVVGDILSPVRKKLSSSLGLDRSSLGFRVFSIMITFVLVDFAWIFFRASQFSVALEMIKSLFSIRNPWILFDGSLYHCGLDRSNFSLMLICIALLFAADLCKYRGIRLRTVIAQQDWLCQAVVVSVSAAFILLFGIWGSSYDSAAFIYFQF